MAYQYYDNIGRQHGDRGHDYMQTNRPSYQPARFIDPNEEYAYRKSASRQDPHQDYATNSHNSQARYSHIDHGQYEAHGAGANLKHTDYASRHSISDYISPPVESRHDYDYILPQHSSTKRYGTQQRHEKRRDSYEPHQEDYSHLRDVPRQPRYVEPRVNSKPVPAEKSNYRILKDSGFNTKHEFMRAHGIKPWDLDGYDQANDILDGYRHVDAQNYPPQNHRSEWQPEAAQYHRPRSSHHTHEREIRRESFHDSDMDMDIDSDIPRRGYISGSDIGSLKSTSPPDRCWSRSPSTRRQDYPATPNRMGRSVSKSPARWRTREDEVGLFDSDRDGGDKPRGRYVSSSPRAGTRRYSSTSIHGQSHSRRSRSRSRALSSGSSILSYRSSRSPSIVAGSDYFDRTGQRSESRSGSLFGIEIDSGSGSDLSGSESGSEIESVDGYDDDDYFDDGFDEQIEDELEFDDY